MTPGSRVSVIGGGPAGCAAALAALAEGSPVTLYEKSRFPRHKVCGEFLSPEIAVVLHALDLLPAFSAAGPARITRAVLHFGRSHKCFNLPEPAYSLSRFTLDELLLREAIRRGAELKIELMKAGNLPAAPFVVAHGRQTPAPKGDRLFGFKAHFRGPFEDIVEMFFFNGCYVGLSPVEGGAVNICGLAPERCLQRCGFEPEAIFPEVLLHRVKNLERSFDWLMTSSLVYRDNFCDHSGGYFAGDAMGFVDPFTGSGVLAALVTGRLAGQAASRGISVSRHNTECRRRLGRQYQVASVLRRTLSTSLVEKMGQWIPGRMLYRLTRPSIGLT